MCGIFGIFDNHGVSQDVLDHAVASLAHRGPDDSGTTIVTTHSGGQLGLAHTRLSIIDLSPLGHQPMHDAVTGNWIVFNGEIYNYRELRRQLEPLGHCFASQSDTEVILAAYRAWGRDSFSRLRGMFAFALWDARRQCLLLVRDPMGIKPLYYAHSAEKFLFASEIRTLLNTGLIPRKLDPTGLFTFLAFGSVYEPRTMIEGISAVPAGCLVEFENAAAKNDTHQNDQIIVSAYSSLFAGPDPEPASPTANAVANLPQLLHDAVLSHLVSDVRIGVFLSGGIDSSSIVALMGQAGVRPATFSLVYREEEFDEAQYSRMVARRFETDHHEIMVSEQDALASVPEALSAMDQPTIDGVNTWLVSARTHATGVKVALTGLGADEMFAGYSNFRRVPQMERAASHFARLPSVVRKPVAASIALVVERSDRGRKLSALADAGHSPHPYFLARSLFASDERESLFAGDSQSQERELEALEETSLAACQDLDPVNRVSWLESTCYMRNTLLRDSDFMSMAHGLELRVPFLDPALVRACFRVPGGEKLRGDSPKNLLLSSLGVELPREIVHRPKRGFTLPFERWLRSELKPQVERAFRQSDFCNSWINPAAAADVWNRFLRGKTSWSRPWALFVLQRWCEKNL